MVPEKVGKVVGDASKDCKEVSSEGVDGLFRDVAAVDIRRDELEGAVPVFNDGAAVFGTDFVIKDLEVNAVSFVLEASHDGIVGGETVAIVARLECRDKYGVGINVVGEHDVSVATSGADKEPTHAISVELAYWLYPDMEFLILDNGELTGDVQKRVNGDWIQWRLPLGGPDTLAGFCEVSIEGLFRDRALFGGIGEDESRPGSKVASISGCKPRGLQRKACCSMEVAYKGSNIGHVRGIQGRGSGAPLRRDRWMRLGKERKTPKFGAGEFAPAAKYDHAVLREHSDCGFSNKTSQSWSQSFPIPIRL